MEYPSDNLIKDQPIKLVSEQVCPDQSDAAAYFQLTGLAPSQGVVAIGQREPIGWLGRRFFFASIIVMSMSSYALACLIVWMSLFRYVLMAASLKQSLFDGALLIGQCALTFIICTDSIFNYVCIGTTVLLTTIGWTCLHTYRNPILSWIRYPWIVLQIICGLVLVPIPNLAYALMFPAPEAAFAGRRLTARILDAVIARTAGPVHPGLRERDRFLALGVAMAPCALGMGFYTGFAGDASVWIGSLFSALFGLSTAVHFIMQRRITACIDGRSSGQWLEQPVRAKQGTSPTIALTLPSGRRQEYYIFFDDENTPLDIEQLPDTEDWAIPVLFEESSARPVAIRIRDRIFPIAPSIFNLP